MHVARQINGAFPHIIPPRNSTPAFYIGPGLYRLHRELIVPSAKVTIRVPQKTFRSKFYATLAGANTSQSLRSPLDWHIGRTTEKANIESTLRQVVCNQVPDQVVCAIESSRAS